MVAARDAINAVRPGTIGGSGPVDLGRAVQHIKAYVMSAADAIDVHMDEHWAATHPAPQVS